MPEEDPALEEERKQGVPRNEQRRLLKRKPSSSRLRACAKRSKAGNPTREKPNSETAHSSSAGERRGNPSGVKTGTVTQNEDTHVSQQGFPFKGQVLIAATKQALEMNSGETGDENEQEDEKEYKESCPICYKSLGRTNVSTTRCGHQFCTECLIKWHRNAEKCPICNQLVVELPEADRRRLDHDRRQAAALAWAEDHAEMPLPIAHVDLAVRVRSFLTSTFKRMVAVYLPMAVWTLYSANGARLPSFRGYHSSPGRIRETVWWLMPAIDFAPSYVLLDVLYDGWVHRLWEAVSSGTPSQARTNLYPYAKDFKEMLISSDISTTTAKFVLCPSMLYLDYAGQLTATVDNYSVWNSFADFIVTLHLWMRVTFELGNWLALFVAIVNETFRRRPNFTWTPKTLKSVSGLGGLFLHVLYALRYGPRLLEGSLVKTVLGLTVGLLGYHLVYPFSPSWLSYLIADFEVFFAYVWSLNAQDFLNIMGFVGGGHIRHYGVGVVVIEHPHLAHGIIQSEISHVWTFLFGYLAFCSRWNGFAFTLSECLVFAWLCALVTDRVSRWRNRALRR
mmetsp:Transcript_10680/g.21081  ORF Transcript_10680/g.21081 Transcript_10680/m.21081 type:complete len:563 (-) Transcript_10680:60-1748(-)